MFSYGQFCPISKAMEVLGERWTVLIIREFLLGNTQFNQLQRALPRISPTTLTKRLAELQESGLVVRKRMPGQQGYEYRLTAAARDLYPVIIQLGEWGMRWARGQMSELELDVGMLMADVQRRIDPSKLPTGPTVLRFKFTDLPKYADWWVKIEDDEVDLCLEDPGHDIDVYFTSDLRTMIEVWMGDISIRDAELESRLKIVASPTYRKNLQAWLPLHMMSGIRPARQVG